MTKQGRPRNIWESNNRVHSVQLNVKAEQIFRAITHKKDGETKWFPEFVNRKLIQAFSNDPAFIKEEIVDMQQEIDRLYKQMNEKAQLLKESQAHVDEGESDMVSLKGRRTVVVDPRRDTDSLSGMNAVSGPSTSEKPTGPGNSSQNEN